MTLDPSWEYDIHWDMHGHQLLLNNRELMSSFQKNSYFLEVGSDRGEGSTRSLAELANSLQLKFVTVDMDRDLFEKAFKTVREVNPEFHAECDRGEEFINYFGFNEISVIYLDAYDTMPPGFDLPQDIKSPYLKNMGKWNNQDAWDMHYSFCTKADSRLVPGGLICFDDEWRREGVWAKRSKGYTAIPWLMDRGYEEISYVEGCILLRKPFSKGI